MAQSGAELAELRHRAAKLEACADEAAALDAELSGPDLAGAPKRVEELKSMLAGARAAAAG
jgi:hypothetical protein